MMYLCYYNSIGILSIVYRGILGINPVYNYYSFVVNNNDNRDCYSTRYRVLYYNQNISSVNDLTSTLSCDMGKIKFLSLGNRNYSNITLCLFKALASLCGLLKIKFVENDFQQGCTALSQLIGSKRVGIKTLFPGLSLALDIAFESRPLRTLCENEEEAVREFGLPVAETLKHRLADLRAAKSVNDLLVGQPRLLDGPENGHLMVINLTDDHQVTFCANHPNNPMSETGNIDWQRVSRVKILRIERNYVSQ